jgi:hypothetical protein
MQLALNHACNGYSRVVTLPSPSVCSLFCGGMNVVDSRGRQRRGSAVVAFVSSFESAQFEPSVEACRNGCSSPLLIALGNC